LYGCGEVWIVAFHAVGFKWLNLFLLCCLLFIKGIFRYLEASEAS
jgi:hypothetical protein